MPATPKLNVVWLSKAEQKFVFLFDDRSLEETLKTFGRYASDPELDFTWYDAAYLSRRAQQIVKADSTERKALR